MHWRPFQLRENYLRNHPVSTARKLLSQKILSGPGAGLKVNFRKVSQEAASEASNKICCYETGKRMNSNIAFNECEDVKNTWSFPSKSQVQSIVQSV